MKKKRRLKKWVKVTLNTLGVMALAILFIHLFKVANDRYVEIAHECDEYYGRMCSVYEIDQYGKGIRR